MTLCHHAFFNRVSLILCEDGHICAPEVISSAPSSTTMKAWNIGEIARRCGPTKPWPN